jgi:hypothetical protein
MKFICQNCEREFEASKYWSRYCSNACRVAAYEKRKKANEKPETQKTVVGLTVNKKRP